MDDRNDFVERVNTAHQAEELNTIVDELINGFEDQGDTEVYETLLFIQSQVDQGDISENPFHILMDKLGDSNELFQRMREFKAQEPEPETTADEG